MAVDDDHVMAEGNAGLPRSGDMAAIAAVNMSVGSTEVVCDESVPCASASVPNGDGDESRGGDLVSSLGLVAVPFCRDRRQ